MNDNIKVGIGFLIPAAAIILFIATVYLENFLFAGFVSMFGLLAWFLYSAIMQISMPSVTGNIIILFGVLLSLAVFLGFGLKRNMFGGYELVPEGGVGSAILLLIIVLVGILFRTNTPPTFVKSSTAVESPPSVSLEEKPTILTERNIPTETDPYVAANYYGDYGDYDDYDDYDELYEEEEAE